MLRLVLELDGELIRRSKPVIGYLHTGMEKTGEELTYLQGPTNVTRMDYASPLFTELAFSLATEQLLGIEVPERAQWIRMLMCEVNRLSSHMLFMATNGMDLGAVSMMLYGWREREELLRFLESVTGLRMNHNYIRPGGVAADLPDGWAEQLLRDPRPVARSARGVRHPDDRPADLAGAAPGRRRDHRRGVPGARSDRADPALHRLRRGTFAATCRICTTTESTSTSSSARYGDCFDRYAIRLNEMRESIRIIAPGARQDARR